MQFGIDVSFAQKNLIDYERVVTKANKSFVFVKTGEGVNIKDIAATSHIQGFKKAGMACIGTYHYIHINADPVEQGKLATEGAQTHGLSVVALDFETTDHLSVKKCFDVTLSCLETIKNIMGSIPVVYGIKNFWPSWPSAFSEYHLWLEDYHPIRQNQIADPGIIQPWKSWTFHQYAGNRLDGISPGTCDGIIGDVDLDRFNGDEKDLQAFFSIGDLPCSA